MINTSEHIKTLERFRMWVLIAVILASTDWVIHTINLAGDDGSLYDVTGVFLSSVVIAAGLLRLFTLREEIKTLQRKWG